MTDSHSVEKWELGLEGANTINGAACRCGSWITWAAAAADQSHCEEKNNKHGGFSYGVW